MYMYIYEDVISFFVGYITSLFFELFTYFWEDSRFKHLSKYVKSTPLHIWDRNSSIS